MYCSFLELYNEHVHDLLNDKVRCELREHGDTCNIVGHQRVAVANVEQAMQVLEVGLQNRSIGFNGHHIMSSRSHAIFQVVVEEYHHRGDIARVLGGQTSQEQDDEVSRIGSGSASDEEDDSAWVRSVFRLNFIDLAGSERMESLYKTRGAYGVQKNEERERERELSSINASLSVLNLCIARKYEEQNMPSKLRKPTSSLSSLPNANGDYKQDAKGKGK